MANMLDKFKSVAIEGYIRNKFPQYLEGGDIGVELDTDAAKCSFRATLAGESQPISIEVGRFEVVEKDGQKCLKITEISSDRKWLNAVLNDNLKDREIKIPSFMADAL